MAMATGTGCRTVCFGEGGVHADNVSFSGALTNFDLVLGADRAPVTLRVPGGHNVSNALAAAAACLEAGVALPEVATGLGGYGGVERRFQLRGEAAGVTIIDDYAHHPTEIKATLSAARSGSWERLVAVFQPHRCSRTAAFAQDFGAAFADADRVVLTDVYGAGEEPVPGVTGKLISDAVCAEIPGRPVAYLPHRAELVAYLKDSVRAGDAVLTMGAGDVTSLGDELLAELGAQTGPG
jgi:UDP-N-acetylmuramate--alanine ligase